ncbi:MAG: aminotransferase class III [Alphaproteobacteria bacterium TMED87]|nr:aminotransferase class III [Rhodospirillaceae bacterium]OUV08943.1 MAG: aminotransferase class III [Alphaproteobacteria bacterium TMED87]|tara:strand:- start:228 stop:1547 length:1320 start_codon:yes stop_codon:yes gene_type:complete
MKVLHKGTQAYNNAKEIIPGGTQLLSKRPEMFLPNGWPVYYERAKGITIIDLDGNSFKDFSIGGVGSTVLGYADPYVNDAVKEVIKKGSMSTLNAPEEIELAKRLISIHPWSDMARFCRSGGEAMAIAVRIARAYTGKSKVAFCGYHGWHDWYLSANISKSEALDGHLLPGLEPNGVPRQLVGLTYPFAYNDVSGLHKIITEHGNDLAAIILEPSRSELPNKTFLNNVKDAAESASAVLIFDEITSAFRLNTGGIHLTVNTSPDIAVFAKALGNGYPISAVIGKRKIMEAAQSTFISSTMWTERVGPTAAIAMIEKHKEQNIPQKLISTGSSIKKIWDSAAKENGLEINISGIDPLATLSFSGKYSIELMTLFTQEMLDRGFLSGKSFYAMGSHTEKDIIDYGIACKEVFKEIALALNSDLLSKKIRGPLAHSGFKRLI